MSVINNSNQSKVEGVFGDKKIGKSNFNLFYGVELEFEVDTPEDVLLVAEATKDPTQKFMYREKAGLLVNKSISDFAFMKHDGSGRNMFEIVTVPMSLSAHRDQWNKFFSIVKNVPIRVENTCGMHVHASKMSLTPFQIGKMLVFIYARKHFPFIKHIGGRTPPVKFAEMSPKSVGDANKHKIRKSALNLNNSETIEFRFFKSTTSKNILLKNIEFCDAIIRFTWPGVCGFDLFKKDGINLFLEYIKENKDIYPNLFEFLDRLKYYGGKKIRTRKYRSDIDEFLPETEYINEEFATKIKIVKPTREIKTINKDWWTQHPQEMRTSEESSEQFYWK